MAVEIVCRVFSTTEGTEICGRRRNVPTRPNRRAESVADYTLSRPLKPIGLPIDTHSRWARNLESATLRPKECLRKRFHLPDHFSRFHV